MSNISQNYNLQIFQSDELSDKWIEFIDKIDDAVVYQHPLWIKILEKESNQKAIQLVCFDNQGNITGILPFFKTKGLPFGYGGLFGSKRLSCLPRTPISGPLALNQNIKSLLLSKMLEFRNNHQELILQIKSYDPELNALNEKIERMIWRKSYILTLKKNFDEMKFGDSRNHRRIKWTINKANRENIKVRYVQSEEDLKKWYKLYLITMRKRFVPPRSFKFFEEMFNLLLPESMFNLIVAEIQKNKSMEIIAGSIILNYKSTAFYAFNGSKDEYHPMRANDLIQWHAIKNACEKGLRFYDFGEVGDVNIGLAKFKQKWGTHPIQIFHYYYPGAHTRNFNMSKNLESSESFKLFWQKVPLIVTSVFGKFLYKYL